MPMSPQAGRNSGEAPGHLFTNFWACEFRHSTCNTSLMYCVIPGRMAQGQAIST